MDRILDKGEDTKTQFTLQFDSIDALAVEVHLNQYNSSEQTLSNKQGEKECYKLRVENSYGEQMSLHLLKSISQLFMERL